jgi:heme A synthase
MAIPVQDRASNTNVRFQLYAVLVAVSALLVIALGAFVTSRANAPQTAWHPVVDAGVHRFVATAVAILGVWLVFWLSQAEALPVLGWTALAFFVVNGCVGWLGGPVVVLHATLAPLAFASFVTVAVVTSKGWKEAPELVDPQAAPLLRPLAIAAPALLLVQTLLGATYRHKVTGVLPHVTFAMIVTIAILAESALVLQHYPKHRTLRPAAMWLIFALIAQVVLGFTALTLQLLQRGNSLALALVIATASHVVVGSLTLAASLVLALQVQRHVRRSPGGAQVPAMAQKDH